MGLKTGFRDWRNRTTIRMQLSLVVGLVVIALIAATVLGFYTAQVSANQRHEIAALERVLELEALSLERESAELGDYSLRLRNDSAFMAILTQRDAVDYTRQLTVENALRTLFYSRDDIAWMELYLIKPQLAFRIENPRKKVLPQTWQPPEALDDYDTFIAPPNYISIQPDPSGFVRITRTIIDSPRTTPLAVVRFLVDDSRLSFITGRHGENAERLYLYDGEGTSFTANGDEDAVYAAIQRGETTLQLNGQRWLLACYRGQTGFTIAALKPMAVVNAALNRTRNVTVAIGLAAMLLGLLVVSGAIHMLTKPLSQLARRMQDVGSGNFRDSADLQGSYEMTGLSDEANHMIRNISALIDRTYVAKLNERTARLAALEAQTNPHFLFNTLQAISTQAILVGDMKGYRMTNDLAQLLRYTIRSGNRASVSADLECVNMYLKLQKARFEDRLEYDTDIAPELLDAKVPKPTLLSLVENSIVHGMSGDVEAIRIEIRGWIEGENAYISVRDDGAGISRERMAEVRGLLDGDAVVTAENIGLGNLASRLRLLYGGAARIDIESEPKHSTTVKMTFPMEVLYGAQGSDRG